MARVFIRKGTFTTEAIGVKVSAGAAPWVGAVVSIIVFDPAVQVFHVIRNIVVIRQKERTIRTPYLFCIVTTQVSFGYAPQPPQGE
jgi:hypothetical protein